MCPSSSLCLESQGCHLICFSYLLSYFFVQFSSSFCLVIFLLVVHSPDFPPKILKHFSLRVWRLCLNIVEQLRDDSRWYLQLAAIWHWYWLLCVKYNITIFLSFLFLLLYLYFFFKSGIDKLDGMVHNTSTSLPHVLF